LIKYKIAARTNFGYSMPEIYLLDISSIWELFTLFPECISKGAGDPQKPVAFGIVE
jgi:hypothetical protein